MGPCSLKRGRKMKDLARGIFGAALLGAIGYFVYVQYQRPRQLTRDERLQALCDLVNAQNDRLEHNTGFFGKMDKNGPVIAPQLRDEHRLACGY